MLVPKITINRYLGRQLNDCRPFKNLSLEQLQDHCNKLPAKPPIWHKLRQHQRVCFLLGAKDGRWAFFNDCGTGKTLLSIALIRYFRKLKTTQRVLVLVPNKVNKAEWARELDKHSPGTHYCVLAGSSAHKWDRLQTTKAPIVIETYAGLLRMVCTLVPSKKQGREKLKPNSKLVQQLLKYVDGLILDESTQVKTVKKLPHRICRQISKHANIVFALTGTPFGNDPTDLWGQMFLVDHGETLGKTLGLYRAAFFTESNNYWGGYEYTFQKNKQKILHRLLANRSIRIEADEADLPQLVSIIKEVKLPMDTYAYAKKAKEAIIKARGNYNEMKNAFLRMRQISSGFLGYKDDELGTKAEYAFAPNPKLEMLLSIIQSIREDRKIIVFHEYNFSGGMISRELGKLDIGHLRVWGKMKEDADSVLRAFNNDPSKRVLLLSNSCSFGLNLQQARYGIFFESPVAPIMRKQARSRFERQGSEHAKVFQYDLVAKGTYDNRILKALAAGQDLFAGIVDGQFQP